MAGSVLGDVLPILTTMSLVKDRHRLPAIVTRYEKWKVEKHRGRQSTQAWEVGQGRLLRESYLCNSDKDE